MLINGKASAFLFLVGNHEKSSINGELLSIAILTGWWFQTFFIFHNIWNNPSQLTNIFQRD